MVLTDAVAYWTCDDADITGSTLEDVSGNGEDLTINSGITTGATGKIKEGIDDDGTGNCTGTITTAPADNTVNMWINLDSLTGNPVSFDGGGSAAIWSRIQTLTTGAGRFGVSTSDGFVTVTGTASAIGTGAFHMLTCVVDEGTTVSIYVDGSFDNSEPITGTIIVTNNNVTVGTNFNSANDVNGVMDEIGIWDRVLSGTEVSDLYNAGAGFNPFAPATPKTIGVANPTSVIGVVGATKVNGVSG